MIESADDSIDTPARSADAVDQLRSTAERLAGGLNLLRWALIALLASRILNHLALVAVTLLRFRAAGDEPQSTAGAWILVAVGMVHWLAWPLALLGFLKAVRAIGARVARILIAATIVCFVMELVSVPLHDFAAFLRDGYAVEFMPESQVFWFAVGAIMALLDLAALFACARLVYAANKAFAGGVIPRGHVSGLLWTGVVLLVLGMGSWAVWLLVGQDPGEVTDPAADSVLFMVVGSAIVILLVAWQCWLLVEVWLARRRLMLFIRYDRCPRCGCQVLPVEGCPRCGLGRARRVG
jgi:hypothetical protein